MARQERRVHAEPAQRTRAHQPHGQALRPEPRDEQLGARVFHAALERGVFAAWLQQEPIAESTLGPTVADRVAPRARREHDLVAVAGEQQCRERQPEEGDFHQ